MNATPTSPVFTVEQVTTGALMMVKGQLPPVATTPFLSVTWMLKVPEAVGVPVMAPVEAFRVRPAGSVPTTAKVYGATPPVTTMAGLLKGTLTSPELTVEQVLEQFDALAAGNDHFEFYWFPYGKNALVKRNNRVAGEGAPAVMPGWRRFLEYEVMENAAFGVLCRAGRAVPAAVKPLNRLAAASLSKRSYSALSHEVFVTSRRVKFVESEYAVPVASLLDVLAELRAGVARLTDPVMFPVEIRVAAADDIWLSTAYGRDSAYVAIHQYLGMPYQEYFKLFESIAVSAGGRPHWGKMHTRDAAYLAGAYPRFADFLAVRDETDPSRVFANPYLEQVFGS